MRILCVEPTKLYQELLQLVFTETDASCEFKSNGEEGLDALRNREYDLVCVSHQLGDMNSNEFLFQVKKIKQQFRTPIILITSTDSASLRDKSLKIGFTEILNKTDINTLSMGLTRIVNRSKNRVHGHILYIEDRESDYTPVIGLLQKKGYSVDHFTSAEDALKKFENKNYDIIITDVMLAGGMTGLGLVNSIRGRSDEKKNLPILVVSVADDATRRVEILTLGASDYVCKPIIEDEFVARVNNLVQNKQLFDQVQEQREKLYEMATTDQLTGLQNRHSLTDISKKYLSESSRHGVPLSLMVIDLDHFKSVNDNHGHDKGDEVLSGIGELLKQSVRNEDMAARFGGEEFVILLHHCALESARVKAENIRKAIEQLQPGGLTITASIGVAEFNQSADADFATFFKFADEATYEAKQGGRNRVCCADDSPAKLSAV